MLKWYVIVRSHAWLKSYGADNRRLFQRELRQQQVSKHYNRSYWKYNDNDGVNGGKEN